MPHGSPRRRTAMRYPLFVLTAAMSVACQRPLINSANPLPSPASHSAAARPPAIDPATPVSSAARPALIDPEVVHSVQPAAAAAKEESPLPLATPLLDSAGDRREALKRASLDSIADSEPEQKIPPRKPAAAPAPRPTPAEAKEPLPEIGLPSQEKIASLPARVTIDPERPSAPRKPEDLWREGLDNLRSVAREKTSAAGKEASDWPLRSRLLDWIADPNLDSDPPHLWRAVLTALAATSTPGPADERARGNAIRAAIEALQEHASLEIDDLRLCTKVNGFGSFEPFDASACKAGRPVIIYCEISNLRYEPSGDAFRSRLAAQVEILTAKEEKLISSHSLGTAEDLWPRKRRDYFVNYRINLPKTLAPGSYVLRLNQRDLNTDRTATRSLPFSVRP